MNRIHCISLFIKLSQKYEVIKSKYYAINITNNCLRHQSEVIRHNIQGGVRQLPRAHGPGAGGARLRARGGQVRQQTRRQHILWQLHGAGC